MEDLERFFMALAEAEDDGDEMTSSLLRARMNGGAFLSGTGARAARRLRSGSGPSLLILPMISRGGGSDGEQAMVMALPIGMLGPGPNGPPDMPGNLLQALLPPWLQVMQAMANAQAEPVIPAARQHVRDALPCVVVTKEDIVDKTNSKCSICLEDFGLGTRATRMFCGHLFCTACIQEWLCRANSCPVCRYELLTNNEDYEVGRAQRMEGRKARLREQELEAMRAPQLKKLLLALGISAQGCVEKDDLMQKLDSTPTVEVRGDRTDVLFEEQELLDLELPLLRTLMERYKVALPSRAMTEQKERRAAVRSFAAAGWVREDSCKSIALLKRSSPEDSPVESPCQSPCQSPRKPDSPVESPCQSPRKPEMGSGEAASSSKKSYCSASDDETRAGSSSGEPSPAGASNCH
jgi:hypothetical protein